MSRKGNIIYFICVAAIFFIMEIAALAMLKFDGAIQNNWISKGAHGFMAIVWGSTESVKDYFHLKKENEELRQENDELVQQIRYYRTIVNANPAIDTVINSDFGRYRYIPADIIKMSRNRQHNYLIINKGSEDGVLPQSGIVTSRGTIGIVDAVSKRYSYAIAFTNYEMTVSARLGKEGAVGTLTWDGISSRGAVLNEIPHHIPVGYGDTVYTSGFSVVFPPDIPLGVAESKKLINGSTYQINVRLFEDFNSLRHVSVTTNTDRGEMEKLEGNEDCTE